MTSAQPQPRFTPWDYDDRGAKFAHYRNLPSLLEYLLVAQDECRVERYVRQPDDRWLLTEYRGLDARMTLASVDCRIALGDIYERLELEKGAKCTIKT